ncbi:hypothetical protein CIL05_07665 [Virgibacillus profundi]|uniref:Uncharacterized protein n=1 Tax=Virgibacillus profundi TaxID=2024555 RepID=A0A2A2IF08_9BACI|nr:hypothetical protein [Virgibacillus profundi]PAV30339.1 hypothetical protein CIL05_07665 [Virgibacillus profundi]PXY54511.1 hypothetical protein CIT14_07750 [Virgibacillus profundi]
MSKFELSIAKDYVPTWNYIDAVRELFQNALDQQTITEDNEMFFDYNPETEILSIGNKLSILDTSSLLLGATTKADEDETIGQFGEGYKIATLVLTRENHPVTFYNYGAKEVWQPRFVNSRKYRAEVLTFFVDKKYPWQGIPHHNLVITVENITQEQYDSIIETNLHLQDIGEHFSTDKGRILLDDRYKGKVFVSGLFICDYSNYHHGYDFKPKELSIDRDRKLVDNFDLRWLASQMWLKQTSDEMREIASDLIISDAADTEFVKHVGFDRENFVKTANHVYSSFKKEYGDGAIPISSQEELESISGNVKPIMVSSEYKNVVKSSSHYAEPVRLYKPSPKERMEEWLEKYEQQIPSEAFYELELIVKDLEN